MLATAWEYSRLFAANLLGDTTEAGVAKQPAEFYVGEKYLDAAQIKKKAA